MTTPAAQQPAAHAEEIDYLPRLAGEHYTSALAAFHSSLQPRTYLEIGTETGNSVKLAKCATICVDPHFRISQDVIGAKPHCHFFQMGSDAFFERVDPRPILGGMIELAFLDGMHVFEFLLRDLINTERFCSRSSVILLHDCLPPSIYITTRDPNDKRRTGKKYANWWAGDVWKVVVAIREYRPDLTLTYIDAPPTGLVAVTNLDPSSRRLEAVYEDLVHRFANDDLKCEEFNAHWNSVALVPTSRIEEEREMGKTLGL